MKSPPVRYSIYQTVERPERELRVEQKRAIRTTNVLRPPPTVRSFVAAA